MGMMAAFLASSSVLSRVLLRKDPLPTPVGGCRHRSKPYRGTRLGKSLRYPSRCLPNGRGRDLDQKRHQGIERPFADVGNGSTAEILHLVRESGPPQQADDLPAPSVVPSVPIADVLLNGSCSPLFQESDVRHSDQWHKEARDQREREALHERSIYRRRKFRPQVEGTEEDCVHKIRDPKRVPHQERLAETKLIITGHACGNPRGQSPPWRCRRGRQPLRPKAAHPCC